jgi:hypothetical protein
MDGNFVQISRLEKSQVEWPRVAKTVNEQAVAMRNIFL